MPGFLKMNTGYRGMTCQGIEFWGVNPAVKGDTTLNPAISRCPVFI